MPHRARSKERIYDGLRVLLAAGGPFSALVMKYTDIQPSDFDLFVQLALMIVPPFGAWVWGLYLNTLEAKVEAIAQEPRDVQVQALTKVSDEAKVLIAGAVPGVATVVVKDKENGNLGLLARSDLNSNIVTETQNELDAKLGGRTTDQLAHQIRNGLDK